MKIRSRYLGISVTLCLASLGLYIRLLGPADKGVTDDRWHCMSQPLNTSQSENIRIFRDASKFGFKYASMSTDGSLYFPFKYSLVPPSPCPANMELFVFVHSKPSHVEHRLFIRTSWGDPSRFPLQVVFVMGWPADRRQQQLVRTEHELYGDILQADFKDAYRNLTYKYMTGIKYVIEKCGHVPYVLKTDDDMFVNMFALLAVIRSLPARRCHGLILCDLIKQPVPKREPDDKWYISKTDWPYPNYPDYCPGSALLMSGDVFPVLYHNYRSAPLFWMDDVYVTGILTEMTGVPRQALKSYHEDLKVLEKVYANNSLHSSYKDYIFCHSKDFTKMESIWEKVVQLYQNAANNS